MKTSKTSLSFFKEKDFAIRKKDVETPIKEDDWGWFVREDEIKISKDEDIKKKSIPILPENELENLDDLQFEMD